MDTTSNPSRQIARISPDDRPFTLPEVRAHVDDLVREFVGEPGAELLGVVAAMLANTRCVCAPHDSGNADVIPLVPQAHDDQQ